MVAAKKNEKLRTKVVAELERAGVAGFDKAAVISRFVEQGADWATRARGRASLPDPSRPH